MPVIEAISLKIKLNIAPIDTAILGLVQLVQPTSPERLKSEAAGTSGATIFIKPRETIDG